MVEELSLARILEECLDAVEQGETDMGALASRYPEAEEEIQPLLEIALKLRRDGGGPLISVEFLEELRAKLMSHKLTTGAS